MTSAPHHSIAPLAVTADEQPRCPLRLRLRPKALTTGRVDGAWWPRSQDLAAELPALLAVLAVRLGEIPRVSYNLTEWDTGPRQIAVLLLVPPDTEPSAAHRSMMRAAERENTDSVEVLLHGDSADESTVDGAVAGSYCIPEQTFRGVR